MANKLEKVAGESVLTRKALRLYDVMERERIARRGIRRTHSIIEQCAIDLLPDYTDDPLEGSPLHEDYQNN